MWCWGDENAARLGHSQGNGPAPVAGLKATYIAHGTSHTCALDLTGGVWCWGDNDWDQLGTGDAKTHNVPVKIAHAGKATALAVGADHTCTSVGGQLYCWGNNDAMQTLGKLLVGADNRVIKPTKVDVTGVTAIAAADDHTCTLAKGNGVTCLGSNTYGQLGVTTPGAMELSPVKLKFE